MNGFIFAREFLKALHDRFPVTTGQKHHLFAPREGIEPFNVVLVLGIWLPSESISDSYDCHMIYIEETDISMSIPDAVDGIAKYIKSQGQQQTKH